MTDHNDTKKCTKCKRDLPINCFHKRALSLDGLQTKCKQCTSEYDSAYYDRHRDKIIQNKREYNSKHRERNRIRDRKYYAENRQSRLESNRKYRNENYEKLKEYERQYYKTEHGKTVKRVKSHRRRALVRSSSGNFVSSDIDLIKKGQTNRKGQLICWWCGKVIENSYHLDHRIPLVRGGSNDAGNLCISCPHCNLCKHSKLPSEHFGRLL